MSFAQATGLEHHRSDSDFVNQVYCFNAMAGFATDLTVEVEKLIGPDYLSVSDYYYFDNFRHLGAA